MGSSIENATLASGAPARVRVQSAESFSAWRALMQNRFVPLRILDTNPGRPFTGEVLSRDFSEVHVSHTDADAHLVRRDPADIADEQRRFVKLSLQLAGHATYTQDGRSCDVGPGDIVIYDTSRPYSLSITSERVRAFLVMMPPAALSLSRASLDRLTARRIPPNSMVGQCSQPFLEQFAARFDEFSTEDGERLLRAFLGLIDAMLHSALSEMAIDDSDINRIQRYIDERLHEGDLSLERIARENYISVRTLQYLFHDYGSTVTQYIRRERLERCKLDLSSPAFRSESVSAVASRHGFLSAPTFNRLFKRQYGMTPGQWRAGAFPESDR